MARLIPCSEFTAEISEPKWLVEDLFECDSMITLVGSPGSWKSFVALSWAMSIATGKKWLGRTVTQGPVVYIAAEGPRGMQRRAAGWMKYHKVESVPNLYFIDRAVYIQTPQILKQFIEELREISPTLIIIDTLAMSLIGNEIDDMPAFVLAMKELQQALRCSVMVLHHIPLALDPKTGEPILRERGQGSLRGAVDTSIGIRHPKEEDGPVPKNTRYLVSLKQKDAEQFDPIPITSTTVVLKTPAETESGKAITTLVVDGEQLLLAPTKVVVNDERMSLRTRARVLAKRLNISEEAARKRIMRGTVELPDSSE